MRGKRGFAPPVLLLGSLCVCETADVQRIATEQQTQRKLVATLAGDDVFRIRTFTDRDGIVLCKLKPEVTPERSPAVTVSTADIIAM